MQWGAGRVELGSDFITLIHPPEAQNHSTVLLWAWRSRTSTTVHTIPPLQATASPSHPKPMLSFLALSQVTGRSETISDN